MYSVCASLFDWFWMVFIKQFTPNGYQEGNLWITINNWWPQTYLCRIKLCMHSMVKVNHSRLTNCSLMHCIRFSNFWTFSLFASSYKKALSSFYKNIFKIMLLLLITLIHENCKNQINEKLRRKKTGESIIKSLKRRRQKRETHFKSHNLLLFYSNLYT